MRVEIPGEDSLELDHLVLDMNGTITYRGELVDGVAQRVRALQALMSIDLLTSDTFGSAERISQMVGARFTKVSTAAEKSAFVRAIGASRTVAIGNGHNDEAMLRAARLGIAVIGREAASFGTIHSATLVCTSIVDALDLLIDPRLLVASLRG